MVDSGWWLAVAISQHLDGYSGEQHHNHGGSHRVLVYADPRSVDHPVSQPDLHFCRHDHRRCAWSQSDPGCIGQCQRDWICGRLREHRQRRRCHRSVRRRRLRRSRRSQLPVRGGRNRHDGWKQRRPYRGGGLEPVDQRQYDRCSGVQVRGGWICRDRPDRKSVV